jgi:hypothetical protein
MLRLGVRGLDDVVGFSVPGTEKESIFCGAKCCWYCRCCCYLFFVLCVEDGHRFYTQEQIVSVCLLKMHLFYYAFEEGIDGFVSLFI